MTDQITSRTQNITPRPSLWGEYWFHINMNNIFAAASSALGINAVIFSSSWSDISSVITNATLAATTTGLIYNNYKLRRDLSAHPAMPHMPKSPVITTAKPMHSLWNLCGGEICATQICSAATSVAITATAYLISSSVPVLAAAAVLLVPIFGVETARHTRTLYHRLDDYKIS